VGGVQVLREDREVCGGGKGVGVELNQANTNKKIKNRKNKKGIPFQSSHLIYPCLTGQ
jgi:hypothetical protein